MTIETPQHILAALPTGLLDEDTLQYLQDAAAGDEPISSEEFREMLEGFLVDAGWDDTQVSDFFEKFTASCQTSQLENNGEDGGLRKLDVEAIPALVKSQPASRPVQNQAEVPNETSPPALAKKQTTQEIPSILPSADIVATSQVSRFHKETVETLANDVDLKDVNISIGDNILLADAHVRLFRNARYGLIGANGVGKSTFLKCLGNKTITGMPTNIRVLYVEQLEGVDMSKTVVQCVLDADEEAFNLRQRIKIIQSALDTASPEKAAQALRTLRMRSLLDEKTRVAKIAAERSGARGLEARKVLRQAEIKVEEMGKAHLEQLSVEEITSATVEAQNLLAELFVQMDVRDENGSESKARSILKGLGFPEAWQDGPLENLSGGWRIRVALAAALHICPDVLLLDEPTNHLDLPAILWLQDYLSELPDTTIVIVSHDKSFLNAVVEEIIVYRNLTLTYHTGNFDEYLKNYEENQIYKAKMADAIEKKRSVAEKSIEKAKVRARRSNDDKRIVQLASKERKLERMGMEVNEKGHRFKLNRDREGYFLSMRDQVDVDKGEPPASWFIPDPLPLRQAGAIIEAEEVSVGYDSKHPAIVANATLHVAQGCRIGIVGANGSGKTTMVQTLVGELPQLKGTVTRNASAKIGYFTQHYVDELHHYPPHTSALSLFLERHPGFREQEVRGHLGKYGIKSSIATNGLRTLSGGQMVRVAFALTTFGAVAPHLLVLDEPTNHLDFLTTRALIDALKSYTGAVLTVSHDQWFLNEVATDIYVVRKAKLAKLEGGVKEYVAMCRRRK
ncbi:hypothetical protein PhCBS80983_g03980 [Powellomyces hirtus]|uniref:ABC transporter domain-containing protein n=1 Tax=Powellomyces hirtus TaxID=109895 RepID=A0A507DZX8_9FUNG|nr:hypothetical protein PhCBS80983_g03980 [Powellomyces hirtus]